MESRKPYDLIVVGGGAAGFFTALSCQEARPKSRIALLERTSAFLAKVKVSGGGRCNVTHACFTPPALGSRYPRGQKLLKGAFHHWQPRDTIEWFEQQGVALKTEADGRIFPVTDSSQTIIDCFLGKAAACGIETHLNTTITRLEKHTDGYRLHASNSAVWETRCLMIATGGCRTLENQALLRQLGHEPIPPVPSLFTFHIQDPRLEGLPGLSKEKVQAAVRGIQGPQEGALLITHEGLSGPVILRLSAWAARELHALGYRFEVDINWVPECRPEDLARHFQEQRTRHGARRIGNDPSFKIPARLWQRLLEAAGIPPDATWSKLTREQSSSLASQLTASRFAVHGKSMNKEEFVTCGGVDLREVDPKTLESKKSPDCWFSGEVLDIDGITGGFNFQAAWTTARLGGKAIASRLENRLRAGSA
jgi:predicted Rossmann fold flavoprotein